MDQDRRVSRAWCGSALGIAALLLAINLQHIWSGDFWWQLANGRWMIENRAFLRSDQFSHTARGTPLVEMRWLWCILIYLGWSVMGPSLLIAGQVVVAFGTWATLAAAAWSAVKRPLGAAVIGLALLASLARWNMRPEIATYLFTAIFLAALGRADRAPRVLWLLPAVQIAWVNLHTLFIMGPILAWTFAGSAIVEHFTLRRVDRAHALRLVLIAVLVSLACWANPHGTRGVMYFRELWAESGTGHAVAETIMEMRSPLAIPLGRWPWDLHAAGALMVLAAGVLASDWRRARLPRVIVLAAGAFLFLKANRNAGLAAVMAAWTILQQLSERPAREPAPRRAWLWHGLVGAAGLLAAWYIASDRYWTRIGAPQETGIGVVAWGTPEGAAAFLERAKPAGNMFNGMRDGGYLIWRLRAQTPVFIDGRGDVYGPQLIGELAALKPSGWSAWAERHRLGVAVFPVAGFEDMVAALISPGSGWALVHLDHRNVVFARESHENAALIASHRIDPRAPWPFPNSDPDSPSALKRAIGAPRRPWYWDGMATTFTALGALDNAAAALRQVVRARPDSRRDLLALADATFQLGRFAEARDLYLRALAGATGPGADFKKLGFALERTGDDAAAARAYRVSAAADPQAETLYLLGLALARTNDRAGAVAALTEALRLRPEYPAADRALRALRGPP